MMNISILGCGWLGLPLAKHLIRYGHTIKGSTTSHKKLKQLEEHDIQPFLIKLTPTLDSPEQLVRFWNSDVLILNIPPGRSRDEVLTYHPKQIKSVISAITDSPIEHVIFVSSTSVYPKSPGKVTETDVIPGQAVRDSGNALLVAEDMLMSSPEFSTTIIRFGGLYGENRHPVKYMAGRTNLGKPEAPVNLIHQEDCIAIITKIIEKEIKDDIFNAVSDAHPTRKEYYTKAAKKLGLEPPNFSEKKSDSNYKIVSNEKLKKILEYQFIYPDLKL